MIHNYFMNEPVSIQQEIEWIEEKKHRPVDQNHCQIDEMEMNAAIRENN